MVDLNWWSDEMGDKEIARSGTCSSYVICS